MEWVSGLVSLQTSILKEKLDKEMETKQKKQDRGKRRADEIEDKMSEALSEIENELGEASTTATNSESEMLPEKSVKATDLKERLGEISVKVEDDISGVHNGNSPASTLSSYSLSPRHTNDLSSHSNLATQLAEYLAEHSNHSISDMDPVVVQYLAHRQLQTLLPTPRVNTDVVQARASLTPLHSRRQPALMQYRSLSIGVGGGVGLDLEKYGHCNCLSKKHAVIFYDELSGQYELINYSQHGTLVDETMYSLDYKVVDERYPEKKFKSPVEVMAKRPAAQSNGGCYCEDEAMAGCEGSALLHHGSLLQFGCLQFVFSISTQEDSVEM